MKSKRVLSLLLAMIVAVGCLCAGWVAYAAKVEQQFESTPESSAWLQSLIVSYDKGGYAFETATLVPQTDYRHDKSLSEFESDISYWVNAYTMDEDARYEQYILALRFANDVIRFMGITEDVSQEEMRAWLTENGITMPPEDDENTETYVTLLYALMKDQIYKLIPSLDKMEVPTIEPGTGLEKALVQYLAAMMEAQDEALELPEGLETVRELVLALAKWNLAQERYGAITIPDDMPDEKVFKLMTIRTLIVDLQYPLYKDGVVTDIKNPDDISDEELGLAYLSAMISQRYELKTAPIPYIPAMDATWNMQQALENEDVPRLTLRQMAKEKGSDKITKDFTNQQAWEEVLRLGYFPLEDQFYSDISNYEVKLPYKLRDIRVRATALKNGAKITVNGQEIKSGSATEIHFSMIGQSTTLSYQVTNTVEGKTETMNYSIKIINGSEDLPDETYPTLPPLKYPSYEIPTGELESMVLPDGSLVYIDENGDEYSLPAGAEYVTDENGNVIGMNDGLVVLDDGESTEGTTAEPAMADAADGSSSVWRKVISIVLPICAVLIVIALVILYKKKPELFHRGKGAKVKKPKKPKNRF
ncbi:MAG TPA: cadherin-like beta sandwich domain-containing protein [Candidatus Fimivicinus intestinavium]|nr:cadherin-like beta sandwich domain-containing protein [Candidatus Fimivicinus intestinavium]